MTAIKEGFSKDCAEVGYDNGLSQYKTEPLEDEAVTDTIPQKNGIDVKNEFIPITNSMMYVNR